MTDKLSTPEPFIPHCRLAVCLLVLGGLIATTNHSFAQKKAGLKLFAEGFTSPVGLVPCNDGSRRLLLVDQTGVATMLSAEGSASEAPFLDVRDRMVELRKGFDERGLLGVAFHPRFKQNGKVYVYYSAPLRQGGPEGWDHTGRVSEFTVSGKDRDRVETSSERVLLEVDQPQFNHDGGGIAFGPDGFLYIPLGDGGKANDAGEGHSRQGNGQDTSVLLGKILRIDVNRGEPYGIPKDNPFVNGGGRPEIFAYGLRNPWGVSFDRGGKRELFVADVGQNMFEEINIVVRGGNYGWRIREGYHCFDPKKPNNPGEDCPKVDAGGKPLLDPIIAYKNFGAFRNDPEARGISVTGGHVYRGKALPQFKGKYIFADWSQNWAKPEGVMFVATPPADKTTSRWTMQELDLATHPGGRMNAYVTSIGADADGEIYVLTNDSNGVVGQTGKVYKLVSQ